jgi:magnesium transporter
MITTFKEKGESFEWIDVLYPSPEELKEVGEKYNLHPNSVQDCLQPEHLPKFELIGNVEFIITRVYDHTSHKEADTIQGLTRKVAIFYSNDFIITIHRNKQPFLEDLREDMQLGKTTNTFELVTEIVYGGLHSYETPVNQLAGELDYYESKIFLKNKIPMLMKNLYHLKRKASVISRVFTLSRSILDKLTHHHQNNPSLQDVKDLHLRIDTMNNEVQENVNHLMNTYISLSSQKTNEVMRVLTVFSVFFMPLTFIVGIYGMNFDFMPELRQSWGYPAVLLLMVSITLVIYQWFKRKGWL